MNDPRPEDELRSKHPDGKQGETAYAGNPDSLHDLFAVGDAVPGDQEDPLAALRDDPNYSALIRDLEYIAKQARLLFEPAEEAPSDEVWAKIQREIAKPPDA